MIPIIVIFDIGKTNKKIILFDEKYRIVREQANQFKETTDENGDPCDDIESITSWVKDTITALLQDTSIEVKAFNVSAYGASFVHLDKNFKILTPLYNYLNPYPTELLQKFYKTYGGEVKLSMETASPALGNLNSGLQLYRIKHERPELFNSISYSLHLPQYISSVISSEVCTDTTSIGCHTYLWDFNRNTYHEWIIKEGLDKKFPPIHKSDEVFNLRISSRIIPVGAGLHDSSAALIPYLTTFHEPFVLLSTGTWCISLNPFNDSPLTEEELKKDCLCYLSYIGSPIKASRLFSGNEHEIQTKRLATHFEKHNDFYKSVSFDEKLFDRLKKSSGNSHSLFINGLQNSVFDTRDLSSFTSYEEAYHQLMMDILEIQKASTQLIVNKGVKRIFVDGGFSKNSVFMNLLAFSFPELEVFGARVAQSTSLGAALAIHQHWNTLPVPRDIIELRYYEKN
jgi:sugar (pentulose or hexulose) kinase